MSKTFNPQKYLNGEITPKTCKHELVSTSGFDDGKFGSFTYYCFICGASFHNSRLFYNSSENTNLTNSFIYYNYGIFTKYETELIKLLLPFIAKRYIEESKIDLKKIFDTIYPSIEHMAKSLSVLTDKDKERVLRMYYPLLKD